jgi:predicted RNA-binding protein
MCLSTIYIDFKGQQKEVMRSVAQMKAKNDGFLLIGLIGEEKFVQGRITCIDFFHEHSVVLEKK